MKQIIIEDLPDKFDMFNLILKSLQKVTETLDNWKDYKYNLDIDTNTLYVLYGEKVFLTIELAEEELIVKSKYIIFDNCLKDGYGHDENFFFKDYTYVNTLLEAMLEYVGPYLFGEKGW